MHKYFTSILKLRLLESSFLDKADMQNIISDYILPAKKMIVIEDIEYLASAIYQNGSSAL